MATPAGEAASQADIVQQPSTCYASTCSVNFLLCFKTLWRQKLMVLNRIGTLLGTEASLAQLPE